MNLELYRTFYFIAKHGNISKASEKLFITQPAVSRALRQLEDDMGCSLFIRTSKGVNLTKEGEILFKYAEQIFSFIETAEKKIHDLKHLLSGEIRIGASDTICKYYLVPYLKLFNTLHPGININVTCPTTPQIISLLKSGKIDFGLINMPYHDDNLSFKEVMKISDCFITGEKYKHLSLKMQPLDEIIKYPLILLDKNSNSRMHVDNYFKENSLYVTPSYELGNMDLLAHFARYDFGIACVIRNFFEDDLKKAKLHEIIPIEKIKPRSIGVVWLKDIPLSKASAGLINVLDCNDISEI